METTLLLSVIFIFSDLTGFDQSKKLSVSPKMPNPNLTFFFFYCAFLFAQFLFAWWFFFRPKNGFFFSFQKNRKNSGHAIHRTTQLPIIKTWSMLCIGCIFACFSDVREVSYDFIGLLLTYFSDVSDVASYPNPHGLLVSCTPTHIFSLFFLLPLPLSKSRRFQPYPSTQDRHK